MVCVCVGKVAPTADVYKHKMMIVPEQLAPEEGEEALATPRKDDSSPAQPVEKKDDEEQQSNEQ